MWLHKTTYVTPCQKILEDKSHCPHLFHRACSTVQAKGEGILWPLANTKSFKNMSNYSEINLGIIAHKGGGGLELRHCQQKPRSKKEQD